MKKLRIIRNNNTSLMAFYQKVKAIAAIIGSTYWTAEIKMSGYSKFYPTAKIWHIYIAPGNPGSSHILQEGKTAKYALIEAEKTARIMLNDIDLEKTIPVPASNPDDLPF